MADIGYTRILHRAGQWLGAGRWLGMALLLGASAHPAGADAAGFAGPAGWHALCAQAADLCNRTAPRPGELPDSAALQALERINDAVNAAIIPELEPAGRDRWEIEPAAGDCEDFALTKKRRLIAAGWPGERLRFATVATESDEYHAVLLVDAAAGPLVLDNRFDEVLPWARLEAFGYRLIAVEGAGPDGSWSISPFGTVFAMLAGDGRAAGDIEPAASRR